MVALCVTRSPGLGAGSFSQWHGPRHQ